MIKIFRILIFLFTLSNCIKKQDDLPSNGIIETGENLLPTPTSTAANGSGDSSSSQPECKGESDKLKPMTLLQKQNANDEIALLYVFKPCYSNLKKKSCLQDYLKSETHLSRISLTQVIGSVNIIDTESGWGGLQPNSFKIEVHYHKMSKKILADDFSDYPHWFESFICEKN